MKKRFSLIPFIALLFSLFVIGKSTVAADETTYEIGTDITFAPFEFQNEDKEYVGIDIDLLKAIAKDQGFQVNLRPLGFDTSIQAVQSGQVAGMIAGMSITDERKQSFDFSDPYFESGIQMAVKADDNSIKSYKDLKGKTVAAKVSTESATFLEKNQKKYGYDIKTYDDANGVYGALKNGTVQAIFDDYPVIGYAVTKGEDLKLVGEPEKGSAYGFAVKKGKNQELLKKFNAGLKKLKDNGEYQAILDRYIASSSNTASDKMKKVTPKKDKYVIASDTAFAPFEFQDSNNEFTGIDVDLLKEAAKMQGFNIEMKFIGFSAAVQSLENHQADAMIAGMTITPEREKSFDFSTPYFESGIQLAVKKGNDKIQSYKDLKGKKVGVKVGTESADYIMNHKDEYGYTVKQFDTADQLYDAVKVNAVDAIMDDYPVIGYAIIQGQALQTPI